MIDSTNPRIMADNIRALFGEAGSQASDISALQTKVTAQGDAIEALGSYSTNETDTGATWIDGNKIYRKVFIIGAFPNNTTAYVNHGITNLGNVLDLYGSAVDSEGSGITVEYRNTLYLRYTTTQIAIASTSDYSGYSGYIVIEYTKSAAPAALNSPAPDDTRSIEPEVREEIPEAEPIVDESIEEPVVEVKKTTRKKSTN